MDDLIPRAAVLAILRTPEAQDTFPDMIRRVEALEGGVRVKPLEWKEYPSFWRADTPLGEYSVGFDDGWWAQLEGVEFWDWEPDDDRRSFQGPEAGMNACKADYTARILAALSTPPDDVSAQLETCGQCMGSGYGGHPDSGILCYACNGTGANPPDDVSGGEAFKRGMLRAADFMDQMADAIDTLIDEIEIFRGMKQSSSRKMMAMAEAVRDRLFRRAGHIPGNARAETALIRAEAAALASAPPAEQTEGEG